MRRLIVQLIALGVSWISCSVGIAKKPEFVFAAELPRVYEGEMAWPCWGDRQEIVLVIGPVQSIAGGRRATGVELYAIEGRYHSVGIELVLDRDRSRFVLRETNEVERDSHESALGGVYEGAATAGFEVLKTEIGHTDECLAQIWLEAVQASSARSKVSVGAQR